MKAMVVGVAVLFSAAAFAQESPPMVGGKPLVQVKPRAAAATANSQSMTLVTVILLKRGFSFSSRVIFRYLLSKVLLPKPPRP